MVTFGGIPVPVSGTLCIGGEASSAKFSEALSAVPVDGVKVSITVQVPLLPATGVPIRQVFALMAKSPALAPVMLTAAVKFKAVFPVLVSVTLFVVLVVNCGTELNPKFGGENDATDWIPLPVRLTVTWPGDGSFGSLSIMVSVPLRVPVVVGVKVTLIMQLDPAASVAGESGHALELTAKSPLAAAPPMVSGAVPEFVRITVSGGLLVTPTV
jgi:hypothetical protein